MANKKVKYMILQWIFFLLIFVMYDYKQIKIIYYTERLFKDQSYDYDNEKIYQIYKEGKERFISETINNNNLLNQIMIGIQNINENNC